MMVSNISVCPQHRWQKLRVQQAFDHLAANHQASLRAAATATARWHGSLRHRLRLALHDWQAWTRRQHAVTTLRAKLKAQQLLRILHFWQCWAAMHHALRQQGLQCRQLHMATSQRQAFIGWQHAAMSLSCRRQWHCLAAKWRRMLLLSRALRVWFRSLLQVQVQTAPDACCRCILHLSMQGDAMYSCWRPPCLCKPSKLLSMAIIVVESLCKLFEAGLGTRDCELAQHCQHQQGSA